MNVIEVSDLCKHYPLFDLNHISFNVKQGEIAGFIGINGSGKTTTIKCLMNLLKQDQGEVKLFGKSYKDDEIDIKNRIGVVLDNDYFFQNLTMNEMKKIVSLSYSQWNDDIYNHYMNIFSLNGKQKIKSLSKGMKMKYALALAMSHNAELLIMDEPTSGLDPLVRDELDEILLDYVKDGKHTVFFSTHVTSDLDKVADHIIFLNKGNMLFEKSKSEMLSEYIKISGNLNQLSNSLNSQCINMTINGNNFVGIAKNNGLTNDNLTSYTLMQPTIEDIMIGYLKEEGTYANVI